MENNEDPKYQQLSEEFGVPASTIRSRVVNGILVTRKSLYRNRRKTNRKTHSIKTEWQSSNQKRFIRFSKYLSNGNKF